MDRQHREDARDIVLALKQKGIPIVTSIRALRKYRSPEEIKRAVIRETNKAFERYMGKDTDADLRMIYRKSTRVIQADTTDPVLTLGKTT